jgi:hypothetical protein
MIFHVTRNAPTAESHKIFGGWNGNFLLFGIIDYRGGQRMLGIALECGGKTQ